MTLENPISPDKDPRNITRSIDPTKIIPGTYHDFPKIGAPGRFAGFQMYGEDKHNVQLRYDPETMGVTEIIVSPGWFEKSRRPRGGIYSPEGMSIAVTLDEKTQEPSAVSLSYNPIQDHLQKKYEAQTYLSVIPFAETTKQESTQEPKA